MRATDRVVSLCRGHRSKERPVGVRNGAATLAITTISARTERRRQQDEEGDIDCASAMSQTPMPTKHITEVANGQVVDTRQTKSNKNKIRNLKNSRAHGIKESDGPEPAMARFKLDQTCKSRKNGRKLSSRLIVESSSRQNWPNFTNSTHGATNDFSIDVSKHAWHSAHEAAAGRHRRSSVLDDGGFIGGDPGLEGRVGRGVGGL